MALVINESCSTINDADISSFDKAVSRFLDFTQFVFTNFDKESNYPDFARLLDDLEVMLLPDITEDDALLM